jgi:putative ABC transport system permease protein
MSPATPPRWAKAFLRWYCKPELLEDLEGDLTEYFERNSKKIGARYARAVFALDVLKFMRLYTIRKPSFVQLLIHRVMLGSYIKTSARNLVRNKMFSTINIVGLAVSMSIGLILIGMLTDMLQYDRFHANYGRIYSIASERGDDNPYASTSLRAAWQIRQAATGVETVGILKGGLEGDFTINETTVPLKGFWGDSELLSVFTFSFVAGNPSSALKDPFSIVLTESAARKLFGTTDPIGKAITFKADSERTPGPYEFKITGVIRDLPKFSHLRFEALGSLSTIEKIYPDEKHLAWDSMWDTYAYLLMEPGADMDNFQRTLDVISETENKSIRTGDIHLTFLPLGDIALGKNYNNSIGPSMEIMDIYVYGGLALIVLLSACFNYTNLSIARALSRAREVGVRKVTGATRQHVIAQFVVEAVFISILAMVVAFLIFLLVKPYFLYLDKRYSDLLTLDVSPQLLAWFVLFAIVTGIVAGILPAFFFSKLNAATVLKSANTVQPFRHINLRKTLIVVQYTLSIMFIASTLIGLRQYNHFLAFDLGYKTRDILNIRLQGTKADLVAKEIAELPEVKGISQSLIITSVGNYWGSKIKYSPNDSTWANYNGVDENYLPLHGHKLISGRNFDPKADDAQESEVIVNMDIVKHFNIAGGDPLLAVNELLTVDGKPMKIIGVVEDFRYGQADNFSNDLVMFRHVRDKANWLNVHVESSNWPETLARIEAAWRKVDRIHTFDGQLYDDQIKESYHGMSAMLTLGGTLSFLAICISSLGLFGMVVFSTQHRQKEVSIRKVLGAGEWKLIFLMGRGFLTLLLLAGAIAVPLTYIFFKNVALPEVVNPAPIGIMDLFGGVIAIMVIALVMIGTQTFKVARTNPADVLRTE